MSLKMYVWHVHPSFLAVAQANSIEEARAAVLRSDLGESGDGSCPERDKAREFVLGKTPAIWYGVNAEFVLTDSAELREQEDYSQKLSKRVSELEAESTAAREDVTLYRAVARTGAIVHPKVDPRTTAAWFATGGEFSIFETGDTEAEVLRKAVAAIDSARAQKWAGVKA